MWQLIRIYSVCLQDSPSKEESKQQNRPNTPKMTNEFVQHIIVEESTSEQWVKQNGYILSGHRWMDDLRFYVLFKSISVISGRCLDDNERLYAMELRLRLRRFHLE